jgi:hypothetical protein
VSTVRRTLSRLSDEHGRPLRFAVDRCAATPVEVWSRGRLVGRGLTHDSALDAAELELRRQRAALRADWAAEEAYEARFGGWS